jgi:hypothetical protein
VLGALHIMQLDELHAFQSGEERAGGASKRVGLEQLWILFEGGNEFVRSESAVETESLSWKRGPREEPELPNHEPFLYESQKSSAPTRVLIVPMAKAGAAPKDWPAAQVKTGTSQLEP